MNTDQFWDLIQRSKRRTTDCEEQADNLIGILQELTPKQIQQFQVHLRKNLNRAYRYDLWAVAYIINGGCSDDGFEYYRCWLIAQGRDYFEEVLKDPEKAGKKARQGEEAECEAILYAAQQAYEGKTGEEMPQLEMENASEPKGERWEEEDLERLYPKLCKRFW